MTEPFPTSGQPVSDRADAIAVVKRLREVGHVAYFAGGCVRDEVMGHTPKDYDIATDAPPQRVRELFTHTQAVGAAFGVILVRHRGSVVEVATFRADVSYEDGRRPTAVRFTTAEEDAKRRDFTINGLFLDPLENRVIDYVGGQSDIASGIIRAIGDPAHRFNEDHLRLLRAARFASRFDFEIDPQTEQAIRTHAPKLARISPERIAEELRLMLTPPPRRRTWELLWKLELMRVIFRQFPETPNLPPGWEQDRQALFPLLAPGQNVHFGVALAALVWCYRRHGGADAITLLGHPEARRSVQICRNLLRISNDAADVMQDCMELSNYLDENAPPAIAPRKRLMAKLNFVHVRQMIEMLATAGPMSAAARSLLAGLESLKDADVAPPPLVSGDDLVARGHTPGPAFKFALDHAYDEQLEGRVKDRDAALRIAEETVRKFEARTKESR